MFLVDRVILVAALLLLLALISSSLSWRIGLPSLVLFLGVGMLAGSEGVLGIEFEDYPLSHAAGTVALALILFDGGLRTPLTTLRAAWKPALVLATLGVVLTAGLTGLAATWVLGIPLLEGLLLGSIVGSTDAAAVFAVLGSKGVHLRQGLRATLEVESGSNDPMAVFLTLGLIQVLQGDRTLGPGLLSLFALQMSIGLVAGLVVGKLALWGVGRFGLATAGLYPVGTTAAALLAYGCAAVLGGSGFLSVYVAGIVLGSGSLPLRAGVLRFHESTAWLAQMAMFVLLGLLVFPSRLAGVAGQGLLVAAALTLVARPLTVALLLLPFRFPLREVAFVSWVGLKGAVPIVLATYPLLLGVTDGTLMFDVVFFVVIVSALTQGWSVPPLARWLGLQEPPTHEPAVALEISSMSAVPDGELVDYAVGEGNPAAHRFIRDLVLPQEAVVAMIARGERVVPPRGSTQLLPGDHVYVVLRTPVRREVDAVFGLRAEG